MHLEHTIRRAKLSAKRKRRQTPENLKSTGNVEAAQPNPDPAAVKYCRSMEYLQQLSPIMIAIWL